ncbi:hypothetical protein KFL_003790120 [Klebsormidium nitens]|uniref:Uncharacterized protein n=1 Tax=Klebsormidium nitens TaxID=105231 RepID=A0A1Y1IA30_KLENI|nr:hypothetical protein KFL_003790120 [Klebsormidium nitens]|eukprot:GAQ87824.1 hypothetical protein KFL_003790120 [Klebsormidium nitens]
MPPLRWGLNGEWGHCNRSIASSLGRSSYSTKVSTFGSDSIHITTPGGEEDQDKAALSPCKHLPDSGADEALERARLSSSNVAPTCTGKVSGKKGHKGGGKVIKPVDVLALFPDCDESCGGAAQGKWGSKKRRKSVDSKGTACLKTDGALGSPCKRLRITPWDDGESDGHIVQDMEDSNEAPIRTLPSSVSLPKCPYTQERAEELTRNLLGRFTTDSLANIEKFFCKVTGWDAEAYLSRSGRKPKVWYRERFELMLESGKRLVPLKQDGCDFEFRDWLEKEGGKSGVNVEADSERSSKIERESVAERLEEIDLLCGAEEVFGVETVSEAKGLTEAEGMSKAEEGREAQLESELAKLRARLTAAEAEAAIAQKRIAELQTESEVVRLCLEGRVSWLEETLAGARPSLVATELLKLPEASAQETAASLVAGVGKGEEKLAGAEALKQIAETRLLEREEVLATAEAARGSAEKRLQEQATRLTTAEKGRVIAVKSLGELESEHSALITRLMAAREGCIAASRRAAAAERRAAELMRERFDLLECLEATKEDSAATSVRAASAEERACEAESRAAQLEIEEKEKLAAFVRERCELLHALGNVEDKRAATILRAAKAEQRAREADSRAAQVESEARKRVANLKRERCELLESLKAAKEECAATSMRAAKAEQRALEAESRTAQLENEERERAAEMTRERCGLLQSLRAAQEERAATSARTAQAEERALEAESRAAHLENEERERVAELTKERCELLEKLRVSKEECAATSVRAAKAEERALEVESRAAQFRSEESKRVAGLAKERCELLESLRVSKEECAAISVRAAEAEERAVEVETRAAQVENEEQERVAESNRERCELLESLRTSKRKCTMRAAENQAVALNGEQGRVAELTREPCVLLESLRSAKVERPATSTRAVKAEARALDAENQAAQLEDDTRVRVVERKRERHEPLEGEKAAEEECAATSMRTAESGERALEADCRGGSLEEALERADRLMKILGIRVAEEQLTSASDGVMPTSESCGGETSVEALEEGSPLLKPVITESAQMPDCGLSSPRREEGHLERGEDESTCSLKKPERSLESATAAPVKFDMNEIRKQAEESKAELGLPRHDERVTERNDALAAVEEAEREANGMLAAGFPPRLDLLPDDLPIGLWQTASISAEEAAERLPARSHRAFWRGLGFSPKQSQGRYTIRAFGTGRRRLGQSSKDFRVAFESAIKERVAFAQPSVTATVADVCTDVGST